MNIPLLTTAYLPPVSYLAAMHHAGAARIEAQENYQKQSYRNRCRILTANGVQELVVPVVHGGGARIPIREALADDHQPWRKLHWRAIQSAYANSPFFLYYADDLRELLLKGPTSLYLLNARLLDWMLGGLGMHVNIMETLEYQAAGEEGDLRETVHPKSEPLSMSPYYQVFVPPHGFKADLSGIDLLFNLGPEALVYMDALGGYSG